MQFRELAVSMERVVPVEWPATAKVSRGIFLFFNAQTGLIIQFSRKSCLRCLLFLVTGGHGKRRALYLHGLAFVVVMRGIQSQPVALNIRGVANELAKNIPAICLICITFAIDLL